MGEDERDLVTSEGVDEGSSASGTEGESDEKVTGTLGHGVSGAPENGEQQAEPELIGTGEEPPGPGQRQQVGEG